MARKSGATQRQSGGKGRPTAPRPSGKGATSQVTRVQDRLDSYLDHHRRSAVDSLRRLAAAPLPSLMTILVIAIALAFPAGLFVALKNFQTLTRDWDGNPQITLYLQKQMSKQEQVSFNLSLQEMPEIQRTERITAEQALDEFKAMSGYGDVIEGMDENPLPPLVVVFPGSTHYEDALVLKDSLSALPEVEIAQLDIEWVKRLHGFIALGRQVLVMMTCVLGVAVLLIVVNTIRLHIENRRDEIVVVKLVGATDAFVRRPFLYTGLFYGLAGALGAIIVVQLAVLWLDSSVDYLVALYEGSFALRGLGIGWALNLFVLGGFLGLLGAWVAVSNHLLQIEPK